MRHHHEIVWRKRKDRKGKPVAYIVGPGVGRHGESLGTTDREEAAARFRERVAQIERQLDDASRPDDQPIRSLIDHYSADETNLDLRFLDRIMTTTRVEPDGTRVEFGGLRVSDLTSEIIQDWARIAYPGRKPQTLNRQFITPLLAVINYNAGRRRCGRIKVERLAAVKKAKKVAIDFEWTKAFVAAAIELGFSNLAAMETFMMTTGARRGSCFRLLPEHLDLDRGTALLVDTKTGDDVEAQLPDVAIAILRTLTLEKGEPVFGVPLDVHGKPYQQFYRRWRRICAHAGIPYVPPHQAGRHSFATFMIVEQGVDPWTVAKLAGWKGTRMLDEYVQARGGRQVVQDAFRGLSLGDNAAPKQISAPNPPTNTNPMKDNDT